FTGAVACMGNVGPGFGEIGSMNNFAAMPTVMKGVDALLMLFGRLEIFGLIQLFSMKWWR
ncbi:MAG: TrkH family potassium uptake protein, partial [Alistipes sp.]|nr:TrkH family potassium uptake protein [Alistipes sp.]